MMKNKILSIFIGALFLFTIFSINSADAASIESQSSEIQIISFKQNEENNEDTDITRLVPNDPLFGRQWALDQIDGHDIDAPEGWNYLGGYGDEEVVIAILDSGVDYNHPDLAKNIWINSGETGIDKNGKDKKNNGIDDDNNGYIDDVRGWNFLLNNNNPMDRLGHGTMCAGLAAATSNNHLGIAGVAGNCKIMCVKIGNLGLFSWNIAPGIEYAVANGADIISMSFGSNDTMFWGLCGEQIHDAINSAYKEGVVLVACAGNQNDDDEIYPAAWPNVIGVAGIDKNGRRGVSRDHFGSNYGQWIDVAAPGWDVISLKAENAIMHLLDSGTTIYDNHYTASGTSLACPQVAGLAALLLSQDSSLTNIDIRDRIIDSAIPIESEKNICKYGLINIYNSLIMPSSTQIEVEYRSTDVLAESLDLIDLVDNSAITEQGNNKPTSDISIKEQSPISNPTVINNNEVVELKKDEQVKSLVIEPIIIHNNPEKIILKEKIVVENEQVETEIVEESNIAETPTVREKTISSINLK